VVRARTTVLGVAASALILAGGWELGIKANEAAFAPIASGTSSSAAAPQSSGASSSSTPTPSTSASATTASPAAPVTTATYTGAAESTQYGTVQVKILVRAKKIVDVVALHLTDSNGRSVSISNQAAPILRSEVLKAQSANVQAVSGASYTTAGYLRSVQSAIDRAGL
jgi:uncharacterized protein with FMN-binding domain